MLSVLIRYFYPEQQLVAAGALFGAHVREQDDVANARRIGQQHDQTIDADSLARSGNLPQLAVPEGIEVGPDSRIIQPRPVEQRKVIPLDANPAADLVRFRFDIDAEGKVSNVRVVNTTSDQIVSAAKSALESWQFEPALVDGNPAEMKDFEMVMDFAETKNTAGSTIAKGALLVLLIPVMVVVGVGPTGSVSFGN